MTGVTGAILVPDSSYTHIIRVLHNVYSSYEQSKEITS